MALQKNQVRYTMRLLILMSICFLVHCGPILESNDPTVQIKQKNIIKITMPTRTGSETNQQALQDEVRNLIGTRNVVYDNKMARNEKKNNNNYVIKRHIIQHQQSVIVPSADVAAAAQQQQQQHLYPQYYYYNPYVQMHNQKEMLQQMAVDNVKRIVHERQFPPQQLPPMGYQQIHNTYTSMIEYEPTRRSRSGRTNKEDADELIIEGIQIFNDDDDQRRRSKSLTNGTTPTAPEQQKLSNDTQVPEDDDYEYEDSDEDSIEADDNLAEQQAPEGPPSKPAPSDDYEADKRLPLFGWNLNRTREQTGDGVFVQRIKVRRGGVAIAGPGGIATAGSGGTAIVGPGGYAYTHPGSVAIAGSGSQVVAVDPSVSLSDLVNRRNRTRPGIRPGLGIRPRFGKVVAVGPVIYYNRG